MKKILKEGIIEECEYVCDKHPDRKCFSELALFSWYGSKFDMTGIEVHLCDECVAEMYTMFEREFKIKPKEIEI